MGIDAIAVPKFQNSQLWTAAQGDTCPKLCELHFGIKKDEWRSTVWYMSQCVTTKLNKMANCVGKV